MGALTSKTKHGKEQEEKKVVDEKAEQKKKDETKDNKNEQPGKKEENKKVWNKIKEKFNAFKINPESKFRTFWDLFIFLMISYNWITVALRCALYLYDYYWIPVDVVVDFALWIDILLRFRITYLEYGLPVTDSKEIAKTYVTSWKFYVDILANIPFEIIGYGAIPRFWPYFRINRYLRAVRYFEYFEVFEAGFPSVHPAIMKLFMYLILFIHSHWFVACVYQWVLETEVTPFPGFMLGEMNYSIPRKLIRAVFWAVGQMNGYANTNPSSDFETWTMLLVTVVGLGLYVAIVGTVGAILGDLNAQNESFENFMDGIKEFMAYRKLSKDLQNKVIEYYTHIWKTRKTLDEEGMLLALPEHLRIEVSLFLNKDIIQKIPFFANIEEQFINSLVLKLKPKVALPGALIVRKGDIGREMFFINRGSVEVVTEPDAEGNIKVLVELKEGGYFGEMAIINNAKRGASIRAKGHVDLSVLTKEDFKYIMQNFPEHVRDSINEEVKRRQAPPPTTQK
ncbi:hypothetical protein ABK040_013167 [Willaertia magna]